MGEKRQDGFHNIESIFLPVSLCDTLIFEEAEADSVVVDASALPSFFAKRLTGTELPLERNIVFKAKKIFAEKSSFEKKYRITLIKRIPSAAGLGGGSSDAAAVLMALNKMSGGILYYKALCAIAAALGSDVPYFITTNGEPQTKAAWVSGRGEKIEFLETPKLNIVLVNPSIESPTPAAFEMLDASRKHSFYRGEGAPQADELKKMLYSDPARWEYKNDFLQMFLNTGETGDAYLNILKSLIANGALFANLSGSGAACFGVFQNEDAAIRAETALSKHWDFVRNC